MHREHRIELEYEEDDRISKLIITHFLSFQRIDLSYSLSFSDHFHTMYDQVKLLLPKSNRFHPSPQHSSMIVAYFDCSTTEEKQRFRCMKCSNTRCCWKLNCFSKMKHRRIFSEKSNCKHTEPISIEILLQIRTKKSLDNTFDWFHWFDDERIVNVNHSLFSSLLQGRRQRRRRRQRREFVRSFCRAVIHTMGWWIFNPINFLFEFIIYLIIDNITKFLVSRTKYCLESIEAAKSSFFVYLEEKIVWIF